MWVVSLHESERFYGTEMRSETVPKLFETLISILPFECEEFSVQGNAVVVYKSVKGNAVLGHHRQGDNSCDSCRLYNCRSFKSMGQYHKIMSKCCVKGKLSYTHRRLLLFLQRIFS